jgi:hypothetical protein
MMTPNQKNVIHFLVAGAVDRTDAIEGTYPTDLTSMNDLECFVTDENGKVLTATATTVRKLKICYKSKLGYLVKSPLIDVTKVTNYQGYLSSAVTEQISYVGYNGTSGSINVSDNTDYHLQILMLGYSNLEFAKQITRHGFYKSGDSATQAQIAAGMCENLINSYMSPQFKNNEIKIERVSDGTFGTSVASCTVVKGSKYVSGTGVGTAVAAVGALTPVKINATTSTTPVYLATYVNADLIVLDVPYQGDNATVAIKVQTVAPTVWGIKFTGIAKEFKAGVYQFDQVLFNISLVEGFNSTTLVTYSTDASKGKGHYREMAEQEFNLQGNTTGNYINSLDPTLYGIRADVDRTTSDYYSILRFDYSDTFSKELGYSVSMPKTILIACKAPSVGAAVTAETVKDVTVNASGLVDVLDAIFTAASVGTAQTGNI